MLLESRWSGGSEVRRYRDVSADETRCRAKKNEDKVSSALKEWQGHRRCLPAKTLAIAEQTTPMLMDLSGLVLVVVVVVDFCE